MEEWRKHSEQAGWLEGRRRVGGERLNMLLRRLEKVSIFFTFTCVSGPTAAHPQTEEKIRKTEF